MKRLLTIFWIFALICGLVWSSGDKESTTSEDIELVAAHGYPTYYQPVLDAFAAEYPNVSITWVWGEACDALFAAGTPPNIIMGTSSQAGKYIIPGYALSLTDENIENLADYKPGTLDIYRRDGILYALPVMVHPTALDINLDLAEYVGFEAPNRNWLTIDETLEFFKLIKEKIPEGAGYYGTAFEKGGNYGTRGFLASFGATWFENNDYSKTTINSPETVVALEFMKFIIDEGYCEPYPEVIDVGFTLNQWAQGRYGLHWMNAGGRLGMMDSAVEQGLIEERFEHRLMSFPRASGVNKVPVTVGGSAGLVIMSGNDEVDKVAVALLDIMTGGLAQSMTMDGGNFPTRISAGTTVLPRAKEWWLPHTNTMTMILQENGIYDVGYSLSVCGAISREWSKLWIPFLEGKITAEEYAATLEEKINKLLAE